MTTPSLSPLCHFEVLIGRLQMLDPQGDARRHVPITGGTVTGRYAGKILPGGGDWQFVRKSGQIDISAHYILDIDGHGLVEVQADGLRNGPPEVMAALARDEVLDRSLYYFRTAIRFRTGAPGLQNLNSMLAVSVGTRLPDRVLLDVYELG